MTFGHSSHIHVAPLSASQITVGQINYAMRGVISNHSINNISTDFNGSSNVSIDLKELAELRDDSKLLYALIDAGVEDWEGFPEALSIYREGGE